MDEITIKRSEYDELKAEAAKTVALEAKVTSLEEKAGTVGALETKVEKLEIDLQAATTEAATEKAAREALEETASAAELSGERVGKLGSAFLAKLPETVKTKLTEQAKTMPDEEWASRLEELELMTGVKPDEGDPETAGSVTPDETARTQLGATPTTVSTPSKAKVSTVLGTLFQQTRRQTPQTGK